MVHIATSQREPKVDEMDGPPSLYAWLCRIGSSLRTTVICVARLVLIVFERSMAMGLGVSDLMGW